jgi:hypothetical protein
MAAPRKKQVQTPTPTLDDMVIRLIPALQEIIAWWEERKGTLTTAQEAGRETRRVTFFVEKRWEEAIRRKSDLDGLTYTQIVNEAFRQYFAKQ